MFVCQIDVVAAVVVALEYVYDYNNLFLFMSRMSRADRIHTCIFWLMTSSPTSRRRNNKSQGNNDDKDAKNEKLIANKCVVNK